MASHDTAHNGITELISPLPRFPASLTRMRSTRKVRIVAGSFAKILSPVDSVTRQPIARADSVVRVIFSWRASVRSEEEAVGLIRVRARRSTVFGTDLLISLLCVCVCVCVCVCLTGQSANKH